MTLFNNLIIKTMPWVSKPIIKSVATKYIAGPSLEDAVNTTKHLMAMGGMSTIDVLGEFVDSKERALHEKEESSKVIDAILKHGLNTYLSIKPTSLGLGIDVDFAYDNVKELVDKADKLGIWVRIDMENSPYTTKTLDLYRKLRDAGYNRLGFVIQAYMRRSMDDVKAMLEYKPSIRLCKGIYKEAPEIAYQGKDEVRDNYKRLLRLMFENDVYVGIATHDDVLINDARELIKSTNKPKDEYEFQMLLGVRDPKRDELLKEGHPLRVYVPFGEDWYGYATRRLKENPDMAGQIFKAIFYDN